LNANVIKDLLLQLQVSFEIVRNRHTRGNEKSNNRKLNSSNYNEIVSVHIFVAF